MGSARLLAYALLAAFAAAISQTIRDGNAYDAYFEGNDIAYNYKYTVDDPDATLTIALAPIEDDVGYCVLYLCRDENCEEDVYTLPTYGNIEFTADEVENFVGDYYITLIGGSGAYVELHVYSSIVLQHAEVYTISNDGYDYAAEAGYRYFRTFACDTETLFITLDNNADSDHIYANFWEELPEGGTSVGRPKENAATVDAESMLLFGSSDLTFAPGWIFFSVMVGEDGPDSNDMTVSVTSELAYDQIDSASDPVSSSVCMYEECYELIRFNFEDYTGHENATIAVFPTYNILHDASSIFSLVLSSCNPPVDDGACFYEAYDRGTVTYTVDELADIEDTYDKLYVSVRSAQKYQFPQAIDGGTSMSFEIDVFLDIPILTLNEDTLMVRVNQGAVPHARFLLDTVDIVSPYSLQDQEIEADYALRSYYYDSADPSLSQIMLGAYVGAGLSDDPTANDYSFTSIESPLQEYSAELLMEKNNQKFIWDGLYLVDLWDDSLQQVDADIFAAPIWYMKPGVNYHMSLDGSMESYHFTSNITDPSQGITFFVEATGVTSVHITVYASQDTYFPATTYGIEGSGTSYESLYIPPEDIVKGPIYFTLYNTFTGAINYYFQEGDDVYVHMEDGSVIESSFTEEDAYMRFQFHSLESANMPRVAVYVELTDKEYDGDGSISICTSDTVINTIDDCTPAASLSKYNLETLITTESSSYNDIFVLLYTNSTGLSGDDSLDFLVFTEDFAILEDDDEVTYEVEYLGEPFLVNFDCGYDEDCEVTLEVDMLDYTIGGYTFMVCPGTPPLNYSYPGGCLSDYADASKTSVTIFLDSEEYEDVGEQWLAMYPIGRITGSTVQAHIYIDNSLDLDTTNYVSARGGEVYYGVVRVDGGQFTEGSLFELKISTWYEVESCFSSVSHPVLRSDDCIFELDISPGDEQVTEDLVTDLAESGFDLSEDTHLYFAVMFPNATYTQVQYCRFETDIIDRFEASDDMVPNPLSFSMYEQSYAFIADIPQTDFSLYVVADIDDYDSPPSNMFKAEYSVGVSFDDADPSMAIDYDNGIYINGTGLTVLNVDASQIPADAANAYVTAVGTNSMYSLMDMSLYYTTDAERIPASIPYEEVLQSGDLGSDDSELYYVSDGDGDNYLHIYPCAGRPVSVFTYMNVLATLGDLSGALKYPEEAGAGWGEMYSIPFAKMDGTPVSKKMGFLLNMTQESAVDASSRHSYEIYNGPGIPGPILPDPALLVNEDDDVKKGCINMHFEGALPGMSGITDIRYAVYALPRPTSRSEYYDASPYTKCGLLNYGQPLYLDRDGSPWVRFSDSDDSAFYTIRTNQKPSDIDFGAANEYSHDEDRYYVTVVAAEFDEGGAMAHATAYNAEVFYLKGGIPADLSWWEILLIVVACLIVVGVAAFLVYYFFFRKETKGYEVLDSERESERESLGRHDVADDLGAALDRELGSDN
eukprot:gnl/Chilomastix_cuspidata/209.p1 GENE.gnl/Chilomastix_cuspidata/209~~gnl/Chilomastix_cuspidata/209.p1  ORF type:complete len:1461 (+),score=615.88 gnl/Chilomastix_cuspidata/209:34-4383(+)